MFSDDDVVIIRLKYGNLIRIVSVDVYMELLKERHYILFGFDNERKKPDSPEKEYPDKV